MQYTLLTPREVMQKLHVSLDMLYAMVKRGDLVSIRVGRLHRFHPDDVDEYLPAKKRREQETRAQA